MGEGWSDLFAIMLRQNKHDTREDVWPMGAWAAGKGIRPFPYYAGHANRSANPATYEDVNGYYPLVHGIGFVWCSILWEVYWNMVDAAGFDADWYSWPARAKGNQVLLQLVVDGMKIQPCVPTFVDARDAILIADRTAFGGKYKCVLWRGFARRGLGIDASDGGSYKGVVVNGFKLPVECS